MKGEFVSLKGQLLLDSGQLRGSFFHRAVVLICHHDSDGAFGLVVWRVFVGLVLCWCCGGGCWVWWDVRCVGVGGGFWGGGGVCCGGGGGGCEDGGRGGGRGGGNGGGRGGGEQG